MSESVLSRRLKRSSFLAVAIFLFCLQLPASGATIYDPSYIWKEIETTHFHIVFNNKDQDTGLKVASFIEDIYKIITEQFKYEPPFKTYIIIADNTDNVYGLSSSIQEKILISPTLPEPEILGTKYNNYLKMLLIHEFTHMVQMDMANGLWPLYRIVSGKIASPNVFLPTWFIEGCAVYNETKYSTGGRGRDALFNTIWRRAAIENKFKSLSQISTYDYTQWPGGNTPYYFGYPLVKYIIDNYGIDTIESISKAHSTFFVADFNIAIKKVTGKKYDIFYEQWKNDAVKSVSLEADHTNYSRVTTSGVIHSYPKWITNESVIYNTSDFRKIQTLSLSSISGKQTDVIKYPNIYSDYDISNDGTKIVFSQTKNTKQFYTFSDIYLYDIKTRKQTRLTQGQRLSNPSFCPDGRYIAAIQNVGGNNALVLIDSKTNAIKPLLLYNYEVKMLSPRFSPDGKNIILSLGKNGLQNIYRIDISGSKVNNITSDNYSNINPVFSPDGQYILFNSDRFGVYNIYAIYLKDKKLFQVTDVSAIALYPAVSPDSTKLAFCGYSTSGFDVCYTKYDPKSWKPLKADNSITNNHSTGDIDINKTLKTKSYSPWASLPPKVWSPYVMQDDSGYMAGAMVMGSDALDLHRYTGYAFLSSGTNRMSYLIQYINSQLYPDIKVSINDYPYLRNVLDGNQSYSYWERDQKLNISASFPLRAQVFKDYLPAYQYFTVGGKIEGISTISNIPATLTQPSQGAMNSIFAEYYFSDAEQYRYSISPENGRSLTLSYEKTSKALGADYNIDTILGEGNSYFNLLLPNHVLLTKIIGGVSKGDTLAQGKFALGGSSIKAAILGNQYYALRGYDTASIFGSKMLFGCLEYRFPNLYIDDGFTIFPVFAKRLSGKFFFDAGDAWTSNTTQLEFKTSCGFELAAGIIFLNWVPLDLTYGVAYANRDRKSSVYFNVGLGL